MKSIESSRRGFVLTGEEAYFRSSRASVLRAGQDQAMLRDLTVDNAVLQRQIPVLVLLDAQMPGTDGFSLIERVRQSARLVGSVAIMLTSAGLRGDAARCRELGIGAYLSKPPAGRNGRLNLKTAADPRVAGYHRKCSP